MANKRQVSTKKIKKKKWFPVMAPRMFGGKVIGESLLTEPSAMKGRYMNMNLMNLSGNPKKQNTNVQLYIKDVKEGQGITEVVKYERIHSFIKRIVRRGRNKVDDSFIGKTKDGRRVRVKTIVITNAHVSKAVETNIRQTSRKLLKDIISNNSFEKNFEDLLKGIIMKEVRGKLSKVTPTRTFDVRVFKYEPLRGEYQKLKEELVVEEEKSVQEETTESKDSKPLEKTEKVEEKKENKKEEKKNSATESKDSDSQIESGKPEQKVENKE